MPLALAASLAACSDNNNAPDVMTPAPTPTPPTSGPAPSPTPTSFDVSSCLQQVIPGTGGTTVAGAVVPDTLTLNLQAASGFPNGRKLADPVIDVTLAVIFLDLTKNDALTFAKIPLNPGGNDVPLPATFPYFAPPQGSPPLSAKDGSNFNFRTDLAGSYVRVDRMGMPAVSTALISSGQKIPYNNANPAVDASGQFVPDITSTLTGLTNALADDLTALKLNPCAKAKA